MTTPKSSLLVLMEAGQYGKRGYDLRFTAHTAAHGLIVVTQ